MSKPVIIGINAIANTVSIALKYGCLSVDDIATLSVSEQSCNQFETICVPATLCKPATYIKTPKTSLSLNFPYVGKDSNGRSTFSIPFAFKASTQKYWTGIMSMCGRTVKVQFQKTGQVLVESYKTSFITSLADFVSCGQAIGKVAVLPAGCLLPEGFVVLRPCGTSAEMLIAPTTPRCGFDIPQSYANCDNCASFFIAPLSANNDCLLNCM